MRPGNQSNKRMRGRGRKGPNPLTRTYESNGPDVKIRGTAMHIAEKYQQLARDAQASGDRVMSENYNQHAEHYLRIVAAAQPQQQPAMQTSARAENEDGGDTAPAANNNNTSQANGSERPQQDGSAPDSSDLVDADSPQPFIEDMPVIDQEGKVNGAGQKAEAGDEQADDKPRRRTRTPRARTPRRASPDASASTGDDVAEAAPEAAAGGDGEEQVKPRRRTARPRRTKTTDEAPTETAPATE